MVDLPNSTVLYQEQDQEPDSKPPKQTVPKPQLLNFKSKTTRLALVGGVFLLLFFFFLLLLLTLSDTNSSQESESSKKSNTPSQQTTTTSSQPTTPYSQLQAAYTAVIGSDDVKKALLLDSSGVATVEYTISSTDGTTIIKTSYENFADLAARIFNIEGVNRLNVTTYATRFNDQFGQPDQAALKLQVTKTTNDKINWPLKKFSYKDYVVILDFHELNPLLQKDYEKLVKTK